MSAHLHDRVRNPSFFTTVVLLWLGLFIPGAVVLVGV